MTVFRLPSDYGCLKMLSIGGVFKASKHAVVNVRPNLSLSFLYVLVVAKGTTVCEGDPPSSELRGACVECAEFVAT
jgi:hypothetical protein